MDNTGQFQKEMKKSVLKEIISLLVKVSALFVFALLSATFVKNELAADKSMKHLETAFVEAFDSHKAFLLEESTQELCRDLLTGEEQTASFQNLLYRHNLNQKIRSKAIIMDSQFNIKYSSFSNEEISAYHYSYNNAISNNARKIGENEVYTAVYSNSSGYSDYMMVKPLRSGEEIVGYISLFLSGDDWSYYMSHFSDNGVITDTRNNVIFYNKPSLMESSYKFDIQKSKITYIGGERYWLKHAALPTYGIQIYSLVLYPGNPEIIIGLLMVIIIGILWFNLANKISETMAEKNAQSINQLVSEIRIIRKFDQSHRIQMDSKDEFEDVAHHINQMLNTITRLHEKNTELLKLNNLIEINHLTAQINPHFLYNTLEIIRNLLIFDADQAGKLIVKLTKVLRYSINNSKRDVTLEEDLQFIHDYLSIQKTRFGERLQCTMDIEENCYSSVVPKLVLQPLIENSIKYGFQDQMELSIRIKGYLKDGYLILQVEDNGPGMAEKELEELKDMLKKDVNETRANGLFNIMRRLKLKYTEKSGMEIALRPLRGLTITLNILQQPEESEVLPGIRFEEEEHV
jgi:sensor histidine kinase YesM